MSNYPLTKISILLLYKRIFSSLRFHKVIWGCICFVGAAGTATTLVAIFSCRPVQAFYDSSVSGTCIDDVQFYLATAIINMMHDFIILVLPIPLVWRLQMPMRNKLVATALFVTGGLYNLD